jgi:hypothetical protein
MIARVRPPHRLQLARHFRQLRKHLGRERVEELVGLDERFTRVLVGHDDGHFRDGRGEEGGGLLGGDDGGEGGGGGDSNGSGKGREGS